MQQNQLAMRKHSKKKQKPSIFVDEHIYLEEARIFRERGFRTIEINKNPQLKGKDELEYLDLIYKENGIFVTRDAKFVELALNENLKHSGIVIAESPKVDKDFLVTEIVAEYIWRETAFSAFTFRQAIIYPGFDGLHIINYKGVDKLEFSWNVVDITYG